jgi:hypothetical protein
MRQAMRLAAALLALSSIGGCATWRPQGLTPASVIERDQPPIIRLTRQDSSHVVLKSPRVQGDSIYGVNHGREHSIATANVAYASLKRANTAGNGVLMGLGLAAGLVVLIGATYSQ